MPEPRSVVITGASRGLGLASAAHLYRAGWRVVAAMRSVEVGLERLREATGASADDPRQIGIRLDLDDPASITAAAKAIEEQVGPPHVLVHNAGVAAAGCFEDMPTSAWTQLFSTNLFGPVLLTHALLPGMRAAGRGRIVAVSSMGGIRGMPSISAYSASKGALERWAESLSGEIAPFGLGVTVLVTGTFDTDIITAQTADYRDFEGPYAEHYAGMDKIEAHVQKLASPPARFAETLARALEDDAPFVKRAAGFDAKMFVIMSRLLPGSWLQRVAGMAMGLPRPGSLRRRGR